MLRLVWGIVLGALVGGGIAALLAKGFGIVTLGALAAYPIAVLVGALVGMVAGKPIWASGARIEAGLKAAFGGLIAAGLTYALRAWVDFPLNLSSLQLGAGAAGELAVVSLPLVGMLLALLFEVDNMVGKHEDGDG
ncbi:MAG: hypothetical protein MUF54_20390, partial [Polyangiaceae bacterium]|nr:hypothetical protein [Polyangiaceae bacterium]